MDILKNKIAVITGGASGIGRAAARLFAAEGAQVAILDINKESGEKTAAEIQSKGGSAFFIRCDVTKSDDCKAAVERVVAEFGGLDILFNNAGIIRRTNVLDTTEEDWDRVLDVNLKSVFLMCKFAIPYMIERGGGSIINTSSGWGLKGGENAVSYCASKGAVTNLTRALAIDHGPQKIRVNSICPGDVDTPMLHGEAKQLGQEWAEFEKDAIQRPLRRYAQPEEIAQAVLYLASDAAGYVTGSSLVIDGGGLA
jgi:NAD(P)-dependent dehydrogenase (short-subunit alcohol dehydrogenase family)